MTRVLLVGLMGCGKSTVMRGVAAATGWPAVDNDVVLEHSTGLSAVDLLEQHGLERLRAAESDVLTLLLALAGPLAAGVPAGVVLDRADRERLASGGHVVYLRTPPEVLARRVGGRSHRPFLAGDPLAALRTMHAERDPLYLEVADQVLEMSRTSPSDAVRAVLREAG